MTAPPKNKTGMLGGGGVSGEEKPSWGETTAFRNKRLKIQEKPFLNICSEITFDPM
jgi:hypothetical protein